PPLCRTRPAMVRVRGSQSPPTERRRAVRFRGGVAAAPGLPSPAGKPSTVAGSSPPPRSRCRPVAYGFANPGEHFLVPQERVLRLHDPVVFIGEVKEPRRHALLPERVVILHPLRHRHAVVLL